MPHKLIPILVAISALLLIAAGCCMDVEDPAAQGPAPLQITTTSLPCAVNGAGYSLYIEAAGGVTPYTWSIIAGVPPNPMTINLATGVLYGIPGDTPGDNTFTVQVMDSATPPATATRDFTITVYDQLQITFSPALPDAINGVAYGPIAITAVDGTGNYTWSITAGSLPGSLSLDQGNGQLSGTPTDAAGLYSFTVAVRDDATPPQTATLDLTMNVYGITTTTLPDGVEGQAYGPEQLTATGGTTPYTWSEIGSNLSTYGLTLNADGTITGTPTQAGTCNFTAKVTDSDTPAQETTKVLSITLYEVLAITTTTLPEAVDGQVYGPEQLTATEGKTPYTWSEVGSNLSTCGFTLNPDGTITGTPTQFGTCSFTAEVTDSSSPAQSAQKALTIIILEQPFVKTWGGTDDDRLNAVAIDLGGNIYCAFWTKSFGAGGYDALLLKYDASGALQWVKTWGGVDYEHLCEVAVDTGGNIYCAGATDSFGAGSFDGLLLKYDASGALQWAKTWGGTYGDCLHGVAVDSGGNIYCAGRTYIGAWDCDALLLKYDSSGALQWAKTWGGTDEELIYGVTLDSGGNIYCAGYTDSFGAGRHDALLLKYDSSGALQWAKTWGGTGYDRLNAVAVDSGGNIYWAGFTTGFGGALLLKYNASGTLQWAKTWGGAGGDVIYGLAVGSGGNIYCAGDTNSFGAGGRDALLLKYDLSGALQWARTWGGTGVKWIEGVAVDLGGNVYLGGYTDSYTGVWQTITTGTEGSPAGTESTPAGTEGSPTGTEGSPTGTEGSPVGSETGAGSWDTLLLKNWQ